jgi:hypothetical protein
MRLMTDADSPDDLWSACKTAHAVLLDNLSTAACFGSVSKPAATRASRNSAILADCRAFILDKHETELTVVLPRLIFETSRSPITGTHRRMRRTLPASVKSGCIKRHFNQDKRNLTLEI